MPRKPINPSSINWDTIESTLNNGKTNFKTLGKLTGVSASTIRRLMLSRYGTKITLKRGRAVGGIQWNTAATAPVASAPTATPVEQSQDDVSGTNS